MSRPAVPAELTRQLMREAGYRCAICKVTEPLEIDHIDEYSNVQTHEFSNMIVLCANCHRRKSNKSDPRRLDKKALRQIKSNLMLLNGRYCDLERRILEEFATQLSGRSYSITCPPQTIIPSSMELLVRNLEIDELAVLRLVASGLQETTPTGRSLSSQQVVMGLHDFLSITLTESGSEFVQTVYNNDT